MKAKTTFALYYFLIYFCLTKICTTINTIQNISGKLGITYQTTSGFVTIIQDPAVGVLASVIVDDGLEINEYDFPKPVRKGFGSNNNKRSKPLFE